MNETLVGYKTVQMIAYRHLQIVNHILYLRAVCASDCVFVCVYFVFVRCHERMAVRLLWARTQKVVRKRENRNKNAVGYRSLSHLLCAM